MALSIIDLDDELTFLLGATAAGDDDEANLLHHQLVTSPLLTYSSLEHHAADFPSRGLLGTSASERVYFNTNTPSSAVICGVQVGLLIVGVFVFRFEHPPICRARARVTLSLACSRVPSSAIHVLESSRSL
jgi:hypothetical protein